MSDDRPVNSKPFSVSSLIPTQKSGNVTDVNSLRVTNTKASITSAFNPLITPAPPGLGTSNISNLLTPSTPPLISDSLIKELPSYINTNSYAINPTYDLSNGLSSPLTNYLGGTSTDRSSILVNPALSVGSSNQTSIVDDSRQATDGPSEEISVENQLKQYLANLDRNILNDYDQATYHLKLFLVKADLVKDQSQTVKELVEQNPNIFSNENIIVIAESGVTAGILIDSVTVVSAVAIDPQFNTSGVNVDVTLKEPLGANFIDYYDGAIDELKYETRVQAPVFLEISFRGYDENGNYLVQDEIGSKIFRLVLSSIEGEFRGSGAEYHLKFAIASDIARNLANANVSDNLSIQGKTVKDFFDKLMEEWNKPQKDIEQDVSQPPEQTVGTSAAVPSGNPEAADLQSIANTDKPTPVEHNTYDYALHKSCSEYKDCLSWEVGRITNPRQRTLSTTFSEGANGNIEATWAAGTDRISILLDILYSTKDAQTLIVNGKREDEVKIGQKAPGGISYLPEIDIGYEQLEFNNETNTYNKKFTYYIQERQTTQIFSSKEELEKAIDSPDALKEKMKFVRRRYDYFGTGKNTEILDLNIKVAKDMFLNLPAYNAQKRTSVADNPGTGQAEVQSKQVAGSDKVQITEGVKAPSPVNPDQVAGTSGGVQTSDASVKASVNTSNNIIITGGKTSSYTSSVFPPLASTDLTSQIMTLRSEYNSLNETQQAQQSANYNLSIRELSESIDNIGSQSLYKSPTITSFSSVNDQFSSFASNSRALDSLLPASNLDDFVIPSFESLTGSGTLAYGANSAYIANSIQAPATRANDVATMGKRFLEDFSRQSLNTARQETRNKRAVVSTSIDNRGGYNLDDNVGVGKSFVTALLGQVYGGRGDMNTVDMEIRGDPLWLGVTNKGHTDQMGSLSISPTIVQNGQVLDIPQDHKVLFVVVFPNQYDENTGLATPNRISEGYTALYNIKTVTSNFSGGKFTQTLSLYQDLSTEQVRKYIDPRGGADI